MRRLLATLGLLLLCTETQGNAEPHVAIVTDVEGVVSVVAGSNDRVEILAELPAGTTLKLEPDGRITLVYLTSGVEYAYTGPAVVTLASDAPSNVSGTAAAVRELALGRETDLSTFGTGGYTQAAMAFRETTGTVTGLSPDDTGVSSVRPELRWRPVAGAPDYELWIRDSHGGVVLHTTTPETRFLLPEGQSLERGQRYAWSVMVRSGDAPTPSDASFSIASLATAEKLARLRPGRDATVSERVLFADLLERLGLRGEARRLWRQLAEERRGEARLHERSTSGAGEAQADERVFDSSPLAPPQK